MLHLPQVSKLQISNDLQVLWYHISSKDYNPLQSICYSANLLCGVCSQIQSASSICFTNLGYKRLYLYSHPQSDCFTHLHCHIIILCNKYLLDSLTRVSQSGSITVSAVFVHIHYVWVMSNSCAYQRSKLHECFYLFLFFLTSVCSCCTWLMLKKSSTCW